MTIMTIPRMFTDEAGESRFDSYKVPLTLHEHAPPAAPFLLSEPSTATKYLFFRIPPGWVGAQHPTPSYRLVICLSGALKFIGSTGETLILRAGDRMMDMNTTGKGHATEVVSSNRWKASSYEWIEPRCLGGCPPVKDHAGRAEVMLRFLLGRSQVEPIQGRKPENGASHRNRVVRSHVQSLDGLHEGEPSM
jgi:hypothetical protein